MSISSDLLPVRLEPPVHCPPASVMSHSSSPHTASLTPRGGLKGCRTGWWRVEMCDRDGNTRDWDWDRNI